MTCSQCDDIAKIDLATDNNGGPGLPLAKTYREIGRAEDARQLQPVQS
jgi:hypothetical protein